MRWVKYSLILIALLILGGLVFLGIKSPRSNQTKNFYYITPVMNWQVDHPIKQEPPSSKKVPQIREEKTSAKEIKTPLSVKTCQDNPNAPDYMAKRLGSTDGHNDDSCAKIQLDMKF